MCEEMPTLEVVSFLCFFLTAKRERRKEVERVSKTISADEEKTIRYSQKIRRIHQSDRREIPLDHLDGAGLLLLAVLLILGNGGVLEGVDADVVLVVAGGSGRGGSGLGEGALAARAGLVLLSTAADAAKDLGDEDEDEGQNNTTAKGDQHALVEGQGVEPGGSAISELNDLTPGLLDLSLNLLLLVLHVKPVVGLLSVDRVGRGVILLFSLLVGNRGGMGSGLALKDGDLHGALAVHGAVLAEDKGLLDDIGLPDLVGLDADNTLLHDDAFNLGAILELDLAEGDEDAEGELDELVKGALLALGKDLDNLGHNLELGVADLDGHVVDGVGGLGDIKADGDADVALGNNHTVGVEDVLNVVNGDQEVLGGGINSLTNDDNSGVLVGLLGKD